MSPAPAVRRAAAGPRRPAVRAGAARAHTGSLVGRSSDALSVGSGTPVTAHDTGGRSINYPGAGGRGGGGVF